MPSPVFERLTREAQILVQDAAAHLAARYDPQRHLVYKREGNAMRHENRASLYYALSLLLLDASGGVAEAEAICNAVMDLQLSAPTEIFHGAFLHPGQPMPPQGTLDYQRLGTYGRFYLDCLCERVSDAFQRKLTQTPALAPQAAQIERLLEKAALSVHPMVYATYEPCSREFLLMCFAMMLEHFESVLSPQVVERMEHSAHLAVEGAIIRSRTDFSPLNTNIQCMHVFIIDYFGRRFREEGWMRYALSLAESMHRDYQEYHAAAEFNSPTYCGVDLATLGFWRRYGSSHALRQIGGALEEGIWRDMMAFFNPAMMNFCGPYSRAYEMDMALHTHFHALFYLCLGAARFPQHPYSTESDSNPLLVLGDVRMPEDLKPLVFAPRENVLIRRQFRELSERGDPAHNNALCTATGWISPDLMIGALAGSENPSYQLHPLVAFWRAPRGLGTIKLLRCLPDGRMIHMHNVLFNGWAAENIARMDVHAAVGRDVKVFFEIECEGVDAARIAPDGWTLPGLRLAIRAHAPRPFVERVDGRTIRVCFLAEAAKPETQQMHFEMHFQLTNADPSQK